MLHRLFPPPASFACAALAACLSVCNVASAQVDVCQPTSQDELNSLIDEAEALIALVEYGDALSQLESMESRLPCTQAPVTTQMLTRMYVYRGVTFYFLGNEESAIREFIAALAIDPGLKWDDALGERPSSLYEKAVIRTAESRAERLTPIDIADGVQVLVDGAAIASGSGRDLLPGTHLLQYRAEAASWEGRYFTVHSGVDAVLPLPSDYLRPPPQVQAPVEEPIEEVGSEPEQITGDPTLPGSRSGLWRTAMIGSGAVTAVGFVTLTVGGTQFLASKNLLYSDYFSDETDPDRVLALNAELERNARLARVANTGLAVTIMGGLATGVTGLMWARSNQRQAFHVSPVVGVGLAGISVSASF